MMIISLSALTAMRIMLVVAASSSPLRTRWEGAISEGCRVLATKLGVTCMGVACYVLLYVVALQPNLAAR